MKTLRAILSFALILSLVFTAVFSMAAAISPGGTEEISEMLQEHLDKAKIPSASTAMIVGDKAQYLSLGTQGADQHSLYQIGSTSKAFTALGILWLEEEGLLSLTDPVSAYLPWFGARYDGQTLGKDTITIADLVYQTSGFTNDETKFPRPEPDMTLEEYAHALSGRELAFYPASQYAYANANYALLGFLIETVSGQSYADFLADAILKPLGLHSTYAAPELAEEGKIVPGSRISFFMSHPYDVEIRPASIPSGYIISNAEDMGRWLQIQLGAVELPPQMSRIIAKSHQPDMERRVDEDTRYAAGWFVSDDGRIYHSGGTPNYSTKFIIDPDAGIGVCLLTNANASANTNMMADNILNIMEGKPVSSYKPDIWVAFDSIFSLMTFLCVPLIALALILLYRIKKQVRKGKRLKTSAGKRHIRLMALPVLLLLLAVAMIVVIPIAFAGSWLALHVWAPYSLYTGLIAFTFLSILLTVTAYRASAYPKSHA